MNRSTNGRRRLLHAVSVAGIAACSGCSSVSGHLSSPPRLLAIGVANFEDTAHTVSIRRRKGGKTVFHATHDLGTSGGAESYLWRDHPEWGDITEYVYEIRTDGGAWQTLDPDRSRVGSDAECALLTIYVQPFDTNAIDGHFEPRSCDWSVPN